MENSGWEIQAGASLLRQLISKDFSISKCPAWYFSLRSQWGTLVIFNNTHYSHCIHSVLQYFMMCLTQEYVWLLGGGGWSLFPPLSQPSFSLALPCRGSGFWHPRHTFPPSVQICPLSQKALLTWHCTNSCPGDLPNLSSPNVFLGRDGTSPLKWARWSIGLGAASPVARCSR